MIPAHQTLICNIIIETGGFFSIYCIQHSSICRPSDSTVSVDAGIEPRNVVTSALAARPSKHSARAHPLG
jgi:hypothetical protein